MLRRARTHSPRRGTTPLLTLMHRARGRPWRGPALASVSKPGGKMTQGEPREPAEPLRGGFHRSVVNEMAVLARAALSRLSPPRRIPPMVLDFVGPRRRLYTLVAFASRRARQSAAQRNIQSEKDSISSRLLGILNPSAPVRQSGASRRHRSGEPRPNLCKSEPRLWPPPPTRSGADRTPACRSRHALRPSEETASWPGATIRWTFRPSPRRSRCSEIIGSNPVSSRIRSSRYATVCR